MPGSTIVYHDYSLTIKTTCEYDGMCKNIKTILYLQRYLNQKLDYPGMAENFPGTDF